MAASGKPLGTVGFVGLGVMGSRMIQHLKDQADLILYDVDTARVTELAKGAGAKAAASLADLSSAQVVVLMLPDSNVVDAVVQGGGGKPGLLEVLGKGALIVDMSSSAPTNTVANAAKAAAGGIRYIDAPVSGGPTGAASGKLAIMVGAPKADFDAALPLLEKMGAKVVHVGDVGAGHAVKALNNLLAAANMAATAEVFAVGTKFGLDPNVMHQVVNASSGASFATDKVWPSVLAKTYNFGFALKLMEKDVRTAMSLIQSTGTDTILSKATADMFAQALKVAAPGADMVDLVRQIEQKAGV